MDEKPYEVAAYERGRRLFFQVLALVSIFWFMIGFFVAWMLNNVSVSWK